MNDENDAVLPEANAVSAGLNDPCSDPVVEEVVAELRSRSKIGTKKYGVTLDRSGLNELEFLQHAKEEALDLANYLQCLIRKIEDGSSQV